MAGRNEEDLKELFEKFLGAEEAERCAKDIQEAEQMLRQWPAPEPGDALIADIKAEVAVRLQQRKAGAFRHTMYKVAAVAAAVIILTAISGRLFEKDQTKPDRVYIATLAPAIWESKDISVDDAVLAVLSAQVEQIESEVLALQLGQDEGNGDRAVAELEMELADIVSDFWKG